MNFDVSVVTPSLNQAEFIEETICSVLAQEGVAVQYIIVDGQSSDGTAEILEKYRDRVDTLIIERDEGQADAISKGFHHAKGRICCYLNSDDWLLPDTLRKVVEYFDKHPQLAMIYGHRIFVDEQSRFNRYWILPPHSNYLMKRWDYIPQESSFWRRDAMMEVGGIDPRWRFAMDYDFFVRIMEKGHRIARVNAFYGVFREHGKSKTTTLMQTTGLEEVGKVRKRYAIRLRWVDSYLAILLHLMIMGQSRLYRLLFGKPSGFQVLPACKAKE